MTMDHEVFSAKLQTVAAEGESTVVVFDYNENKSHPVPDRIRAEIEKLEGKAF